jgi:hypothetical protein
MAKPAGSNIRLLLSMGVITMGEVGSCNNCSYSSVVQKAGVVKLYCTLMGKPLDLLEEDCGHSKDVSLRAIERHPEGMEK